MFQLYSDTGRRIATLKDCKNIKIIISLEDGEKELSFSLNRENEYASRIKNEYYIRTKTDRFVIKEVSDDGRGDINIVALLDLEDLEGKMFPAFKTTEKRADECLAEAFAGTGWSVGICEITKRRTVKKDNPCNALEIVAQCRSTYDCEIRYDTLARRVDILKQIGADRGAYFIESLNLRKSKSLSTSYDFYTRLIPIGKNGVGININGKNYVEDYTYSNKIKTYVWRDERYTHPETLAEDGALKLAQMARPYAVYTADVIDLAAASELYRDIPEYGIGDIVTLVSKRPKIREKMRIVKMTVYPLSPEKNTCELANAKKNFADVLAKEKSEAVSESVAVSESNTAEAIERFSRLVAAEYSTKTATALIEASAYAYADEAVSSIRLGAFTDGNKALITLQASTSDGSTVNIDADEIVFDGLVTFENLLEPGKTVINGGNILTNSITADQIDASELYVASANIEGTLTANQIDCAGVIVAAQALIKSLAAEQIEATNITADAVDFDSATITGTLEAGNINCAGVIVAAQALIKSLAAEQIEATYITADAVDFDSATITGTLEAANINCAGVIVAAQALIKSLAAEQIEATSITADAVDFDSATITGTLEAGNIDCNGVVNAASLEVKALAAQQIAATNITADEVDFDTATITGTLEAANINCAGVIVAAQALIKSLAADQIEATYITADAVDFDSATITGKLKASHMDATGLAAVNVDITGTAKINYGKIGGWSIVPGEIGGYSSGESLGISFEKYHATEQVYDKYYEDYIYVNFYAGANGDPEDHAPDFYVLSDGTIGASKGRIGGWIIENESIHSASGKYESTVSYLTSGGASRTMTGNLYVFTALSGNGIYYIVRTSNSYPTQRGDQFLRISARTNIGEEITLA